MGFLSEQLQQYIYDGQSLESIYDIVSNPFI